MGAGLLSDRDESLMLSFQRLPGARGIGKPAEHAANRTRVDISLKSYTSHVQRDALVVVIPANPNRERHRRI